MESLAQLLNLPFATLSVLACGYVGYRIAFIGHDGPHTAVDVVFISLAFAALAKAVMVLHGGEAILAAIPAFGVVFLAALAWRLWLSPCWQAQALLTGLIDHDRGRNVWESMLMRKIRGPTRILVTLKTGQQFLCDDVSKFCAAPLGPCLLGSDGSVAMYVTSTRSSNLEDWIEVTPYSADSDDWGYDMTFISASEIQRVRIMRPI